MSPTEPEPVTLSQIVEQAVVICDPPGEDDLLGDLLARFEDRDEPVSALGDVETTLAEATGALDPEGDDPALAMAAAVAVYLAHRRDEVGADREDLLRLAARAEFDDRPPPAVQHWLEAQGVEA